MIKIKSNASNWNFVFILDIRQLHVYHEKFSKLLLCVAEIWNWDDEIKLVQIITRMSV